MSATSTINTAYVPNAGLTADAAEGDSDEIMGTTVYNGENKFYYKVDKSVFLFNSEAERQSMLEWASSVSGVAIDALEAKDVKGVVNKYELTTDWNTVSDLFTGDDGKETRAWMITVKTPIFDKIDTKISKDFFGGEAPFFSPGSEQYLKHRSFNFNGDPAVDGGQLAGLTGSAQFLFNKNYEGKTTTPTDLAALPDPVETLCKSLFGSDVAITQEHLNILKLMGLVTGDATKGVGDWALSTAGQTSSSKLAEKEPLKFIASMATLAMKPEDLVEASGASVFFKGDAYAPVADSNPAKNYAATDVESLAKKVYKNMEGTVETLPAGLGATTGQKDSILKLVTNLLNLPATTTWEQLTPSQINTAISMGLAAYNPTTNALTLTGNGATYISSKAAVPATAPPVTTAAAEQDTGLKAFWDALNTFYTTGGPLGADRAEVHRHDAGVKNDRFGTLGIGALGQASATDEDFWKDAELSHLNGDQRTQLINASNTLLKPEYGTYLAQVSTLNGGSGEANVFLTGQMNTWLVNVPRLRAAYTPIGTPMTRAMKAATRASSSVAGKRSPIRRETLAPWRRLRPNSPWAALTKKCQNCTKKGLSRPSEARSSRICSGVASWPSRNTTGSPTYWNSMKEMKATVIMTITACIRRRNIKASIGESSECSIGAPQPLLVGRAPGGETSSI